MKSRQRALLFALLVAALLGSSHRVRARAADGGTADAAMDAKEPTKDGGTRDASPPPSDETPLACGGALCSTATGATACSVVPGFGSKGTALPVSASAILLALGLRMLRRRGRQSILPLLLASVGVGVVVAARGAQAEPQPVPASSSESSPPPSGPDAVPSGPVDVTMPAETPERRYVAIEWNPLPFLTMRTGDRPSDPGRPTQGGLGKLSANVVVAPLEHHAVVVSPYYVLTRTTPINIWDSNLNPTALPIQTFRGYGTELGYRYYMGRGGLRGAFFGPSLIISAFTVTAENGDKKSYLDYGVAGDFGYQALVLDRLSLSIGAGLQYTTTSKSIPEQMLWAKVFANTALLPRALISVGYAL